MEVTLLTEEQIFGENKSKIFEKYGTSAAITDFAILLDGYFSDEYHCNNSDSLEDRTVCYWTSSVNKDNYACVVDKSGNRQFYFFRDHCIGARSTLPYSLISRISMNKVREFEEIFEVEYGEYPQKAVSRILQEELENAYQNKQTSIRKTGKAYATDPKRWNEHDKKFSVQEYEEFEYKGKRYMRIKVNSYYEVRELKLSNGERYKNGDYVWIEVSPIKWLVDIEKDIVLSERILFAGIQFDDKEEYKGNFKETFMYKYLNTIFIKDIQVSKEIEISVIEEKSKRELALEKLEEDKQKILNLKKNLRK